MKGVGIGMVDGIAASLGGIPVNKLEETSINEKAHVVEDVSVSSERSGNHAKKAGEHAPFVIGFPRWSPHIHLLFTYLLCVAYLLLPI